jgi:hypothetical protein
LVLLCDAAPDLSGLLELVRASDDAEDALGSFNNIEGLDKLSASRWLKATQRSHLYVHSGYDVDLVEELFATPIEKASEVQRLIDGSESLIVLNDAHKCRVG